MKLRSPEALVDIMDRRGVSLRALATEVGCSSSFIAHLRVGRKTSCSAELAGRISRALDSSLIFLPTMPTVDRQINQQCMAGEAAA